MSETMRCIFERDELGFDTYCGVCGVPVKQPPELKDNPLYDWWDGIIGLRVVETDNGESIIETLAKEDLVFVAWRDTEPEHVVNGSYEESPTIALHSECFEIMQRIVDHRKALISLTLPIDGPLSINDFWKVFCSRVDHENRAGEGFYRLWMNQPRIIEPHAYFIHASESLANCYQWPIGWSEVLQYEYSPLTIPNLTYDILDFLKPLPVLPSKSFCDLTSIVELIANKPSLEQMINQLPVELQNQIYSHLHPLGSLSVECTRQSSPEWWRDLLFHNSLFPWLWDIDSTVLQASRLNLPAYNVDNLWDWEQLVRQLAQVEVFETGNPLDQAPLGLRNRRRIWRLLEEARLDDIIEYVKGRFYINYPQFAPQNANN